MLVVVALVVIFLSGKGGSSDEVSDDNTVTQKEEIRVSANSEREESGKYRISKRPSTEIKLDSHGRRMLTFEEASKELRRKGIVYHKARELGEVPENWVKSVKKKMTPVLSQNSVPSRYENPDVSKFSDAYYHLNLVVNIGNRENFAHSFHDDGEIFFLWAGHTNKPTIGYAVRKEDAKFFKWDLKDEKKISKIFKIEDDFGYFRLRE